MAIAILMPGRSCSELLDALRVHSAVPVLDASQPLTESERAAVRLAVVWYPPTGFEADFPNLQAVMSYGAGAEFLTQGQPLPSDLILGRLVDPHLRQQMARYLLSIVLSEQGRLTQYRQLQSQSTWQPLEPLIGQQIGFLGRGVLAHYAGEQCAALGYSVAYWQRQANPDHSDSCDGEKGLQTLLSQSDVIICLLPLTDSTRGLINAARLSHCKSTAMLINVGRGGLVNYSDLIRALDQGQIGQVWLDVTDPEPLPSDSPLWQHEQLRITPHIASKTDPVSAATTIVENYRSLQTGSGLLNPVNRLTGY